MVTEQSRVPVAFFFFFLYFDLKGYFCVMRPFYYTSYSFYLVNVVLMPFVAFGSDLLWLIPVRLLTVQLFFFILAYGTLVRIGFEPFNNLTINLQYFNVAFVARCCVSYYGYLSFDPFFSIVASLKAMQFVTL